MVEFRVEKLTLFDHIMVGQAFPFPFPLVDDCWADVRICALVYFLWFDHNLGIVIFGLLRFEWLIGAVPVLGVVCWPTILVIALVIFISGAIRGSDQVDPPG